MWAAEQTNFVCIWSGVLPDFETKEIVLTLQYVKMWAVTLLPSISEIGSLVKFSDVANQLDVTINKNSLSLCH